MRWFRRRYMSWQMIRCSVRTRNNITVNTSWPSPEVNPTIFPLSRPARTVYSQTSCSFVPIYEIRGNNDTFTYRSSSPSFSNCWYKPEYVGKMHCFEQHNTVVVAPADGTVSVSSHGPVCWLFQPDTAGRRALPTVTFSLAWTHIILI